MSRPTLQQLNDWATADIQANLQGASPRTRRGPLGVFARVWVGLAHMLFGEQEQHAKRQTPFTAEGDDRLGWAGLFGISRTDATVASGSSCTAVGGIGRLIPREASLQSDAGVVYVTQEDAVIGEAGTANIAVRAVLPGANGNLAAGEKLTFVSAPVGVQPRVSVTGGGITGGSDTETVDRVWSRLLERLSNAPHGGSRSDYVQWALEVPSITRAWAHPAYNGPGSVRVYVINDDYIGGGTAAAADVTQVFDYIDGQKKPVGMVRWGRLTAANFIADPDDAGAIIPNPANPPPVANGLEVLAPAKALVTPTIAGVTDLNTRAVMQAALAQFLREEAVPEGSVKRDRLVTALGKAAGGSDFEMSAPTAATISASAGAILWPGVITWT